MTYPSLPVDDFAHRPQIQIIFRGAKSATFPSLFSKGQLTHPPPDEIFRDTYPPLYAWSNKEFEEFPTSFASSKTSYFIRLFGLLTSDAGIFVWKYYLAYLKYHAPF